MKKLALLMTASGVLALSACHAGTSTAEAPKPPIAHVDGQPVRSCVTPVSSVANAKIATIESLGVKGDHPVQRAWIELDVVQCGYCQSGQIMSAVALVESNANPTDADIDAAMDGNICRCGTYPRIRAAIKRAAEIKRNGGAA